MTAPETPHPILLVEDDEELRDLLVVLFELRGRTAVAVANGDEALERLRAGLRPCLIIFDLLMPGKAGLEFRAEQLADPELAAIPAIAISAAVQGASVLEMLKIDEFLPKPLDFDRLIACIERHCPRPD